MIGPVYVEHTAAPVQYPVFIFGDRKDMLYFTEPINATTPLYYSKTKGLLVVEAQKPYKVADVSVHTGLEGEVQLLQSQCSQDILESDGVPSISNVDVQKAFSLLNPLFKRIVAVAKDSKTLSLAYEGLRRTHVQCLELQDGINQNSSRSVSTGKVRFRSSNLELDK